jgi:hypothetical protein
MSTRGLAPLILAAIFAGCGRPDARLERPARAMYDQTLSTNATVPLPRAALPVSYDGVARAEAGDPRGFRLPRRADLAVSDTAADPARLVAVSSAVTLLVDSVTHATDDLRVLATRLGGYVAGSSFDRGAGSELTASVEIKVPADRFERLLTGVQALGRVESLHSTSAEVGEEYVDVTARLRNARRLEERLVGMAATRGGRVSDLLAVERALAQTREEIERYEGRVRYLRAETVYSTLDVTVHDLPRIGAPASETSFLMGALAQARHNFLFLIGFVIEVSGVVLPLVLVALVGWGIRSRLGGGGAAPFALDLRRSRGE